MFQRIYLCIALTTAALSPLSAENTILAGISYGGLFDFTENMERIPRGFTRQAAGFTTTAFIFGKNRNHGIFGSFGIMVFMEDPPDGVRRYIGGIMETLTGWGMRAWISNKATLLYGLGFKWDFEGADYHVYTDLEAYSLMFCDMGLGGTVQLKLDITNGLSLVAGANLWWIALTCKLPADGGASAALASSFNAIVGIKPYLGMAWDF